jgi:two-component system response regulator NreC
VSAKKQIIKVLVADDHPVVRKGLQTCLARQPRIKVVGEAADGDEALRKALELLPHVVLMDISMPGMNGLAVTEQLRKEAPEVKVLIISVHKNKEAIFRVIQAGANGYVSKEAPPEELLRAIESIYEGEPFFSEEIARAALAEFVKNGGKKESPTASARCWSSLPKARATRKSPTGSALASAPSKRTGSASCAA